MNQQRRVIVAGLYTALLMVVSWLLFDRWVPPLGSEGVWFFAGLATLLMSTALTEHFFTRPADALINGIAALLVAVTFSRRVGVVEGASPQAVGAGKVALAVGSLAIVAFALLAIFTKDRPGRASRVSASAARISGTIGSAKLVFSVVFLLAAYAAYSRSPYRLATLVAVWILIVVIRPVEGLFLLDWLALRHHEEAVGRVVGLRHPGLVEVAVTRGVAVRPGDSLVLAAGALRAAVLDVSAGVDGSWALVSVSGRDVPELGSLVVRAPKDDKQDQVAVVLGPIEPGTDMNEIHFRVPNSIEHLKEGSLVETELRGEPVLYQVVQAQIRHESLMSPVDHRFINVEARKIGVWDGVARKFRRAAWLPDAGTPVHLATQGGTGMQTDCIGLVPDTSYGIRVDSQLLVTHNTAILGILGIGKTFLAFELIRRIILAGKKVIVLDITGQYGPEFRDVFPEDTERMLLDEIAAKIAATRDNVTKSVHEGGNYGDFRRAVREDLSVFLKSPDPIRIYNPGAFDVIRQDSKPYMDQASMAPLTVAETTRVLAEELLSELSGEITQEARVCLVIEEAHSLVPEWNSTTYEGDQRASNGTAKAVLQGRKYGLGVILVTQRTANVTKTILNQCNTVFALRTFDATGMDFLRNYIGSAYADVLSGLEDRTAVVFGRASSCESPVILRINDRDEMMTEVWQPGIANLLADGTADEGTERKTLVGGPPIQEVSGLADVNNADSDEGVPESLESDGEA